MRGVLVPEYEICAWISTYQLDLLEDFCTSTGIGSLDGLGFGPRLSKFARRRICRTATQSGDDSHFGSSISHAGGQMKETYALENPFAL